MTILLPTLAATFAALCVWLTVRTVNRRERWAKRTAVGIIGALPALYAASYVCLVNVPTFSFASGQGPWQRQPHYMIGRRELDQEFWSTFFGPAHWIDMRVRPKKWTVSGLGSREVSPEEIDALIRSLKADSE